MFSNGGNYGLPVVSFAFGPDALTYGTVFFLTGSVLTNTVGAFLAAAGQRSVRSALAGVLRIPALYGIAAAVITLNAGIEPPHALMRPVTMLSEAALPLMILVLGMQLERASAPRRPALVFTAVRPLARSRAARGTRPHLMAWGHRSSPAGRRGAVVDAGRCRHDDSRARVRHCAGFRHQRCLSLDSSESAYACSTDCLSSVTLRAADGS